MIFVELVAMAALVLIITISFLCSCALVIVRAIAATRQPRPIVLQVVKEKDKEPRWSPPYFGPQL